MSKTKPQKIGKTISPQKTTKIAQEDKLLESNEKSEEKKETLTIREFTKQYYKLKEYYTIFLKKYDPILKEYNTKLEEYYTKLKEGKNLTFEDIKSIIEYFEDIESIIQYFKDIKPIMEHISNKKFLDSILIILDEDIKLRKKNSGIDCIEKLYEYNELLSKEFRLKKPKQNDKKALIREKLRAIIMDNYRKNYNYIGKEFIDKKLNYEDYKKGIDILDEKTFSLLLKVKVITQN
jgi:molybdopterin converting factor small subunit